MGTCHGTRPVVLPPTGPSATPLTPDGPCGFELFLKHANQVDSIVGNARLTPQQEIESVAALSERDNQLCITQAARKMCNNRELAFLWPLYRTRFLDDLDKLYSQMADGVVCSRAIDEAKEYGRPFSVEQAMAKHGPQGERSYVACAAGGRTLDPSSRYREDLIEAWNVMNRRESMGTEVSNLAALYPRNYMPIVYAAYQFQMAKEPLNPSVWNEYRNRFADDVAAHNDRVTNPDVWSRQCAEESGYGPHGLFAESSYIRVANQTYGPQGPRAVPFNYRGAVCR